MKCTDFWAIENSLKDASMKELVKALEAHGGEYEWFDNEIEPDKKLVRESPVITVTFGFNDYQDVHISSIYLTRLGYVTAIVYVPNQCKYVGVSIDYIPASSIQNIIEHIPNTDDVSDVSSGECCLVRKNV